MDKAFVRRYILYVLLLLRFYALHCCIEIVLDLKRSRSELLLQAYGLLRRVSASAYEPHLYQHATVVRYDKSTTGFTFQRCSLCSSDLVSVEGRSGLCYDVHIWARSCVAMGVPRWFLSGQLNSLRRRACSKALRQRYDQLVQRAHKMHAMWLRTRSMEPPSQQKNQNLLPVINGTKILLPPSCLSKMHSLPFRGQHHTFFPPEPGERHTNKRATNKHAALPSWCYLFLYSVSNPRPQVLEHWS